MKVVHLNTYTKGGAAIAAIRLHRALKQSGINSTFISLYKDGEMEDSIVDFRDAYNPFSALYYKTKNYLNQQKVKNIIQSKGEWFSRPDTVWKIKNHPLIQSADVIHFHWVSGFLNVEELPQLNGKKLVWTLHDEFPFSGGFHYPPMVDALDLSDLILRQKNQISTALLKTDIQFITPTQVLANKVTESNWIRKTPVQVIKNPVPHHEFRITENLDFKSNLNIKNDQPVFLFIADEINYARKGFHVLREALALVDVPSTTIVVGKGDVSKSINKSEIIQLGEINSTEMLNQIYNTCDFLLNPGLNDIASNTIVEAGLCGKPVVCTPVPAYLELMNEQTGVFASEFTGQAFAIAIERALQMNFDRNIIRQHYLRFHSPEVIAREYIRMYQEW